MTTNLEAREALTGPLSQLERYAGWLGKDQVSVAVRADVKALSAAMDTGGETSLLLLTLDQNIGRLPSGDVRKIVRKALIEIRAVLEPSEIDPYDDNRAKRSIVKD
jgi:hypothetical protein